MSENVHDKARLRELQALPLERKIMITQARIIEWYSRYNGKVFVTFSGGKDSTVLLDIARKCFPDIPAVFVDTGLEYPEIRDFVKTVDNVTWIKPDMNFKKVIETYGYPVGSKRTALNIEYGRKALFRGDMEMYDSYVNGKRIGKKSGEEYTFMPINERFMGLFHSNIKVSNKCCDVMKKKTISAYIKETDRKPIIATLATESKMRTDGWVKTGCNNFDKRKPQSKPMSFWTEQDVLRYLRDFNIPYASIYGDILQNPDGELSVTKLKRTGCMFCMFGVHLEKEPNRFQRMKETHPKQWTYMLKPVSEGGLGLKEVLDYIGVKYE